MRRASLFFIVFGLLALMTACGRKGAASGDAETANGQTACVQKPVRYEFGLPIDSFRIDTCVVQDGETLGGILSRLGASSKQVGKVGLLSRDQLDVRQIRSGKTYYAFYQDTYLKDTINREVLCYWIYQSDRRHAIILHLSDPLEVTKEEKPLVTEERCAEAVIESSLWNAMVSRNLPVELALELSEIYAWTIDFFALQQGDSIRVCYDAQLVDGEYVGLGRIHACHFYHGGKWINAYWFDDGNACKGYFDEKGTSLRKAFLKAPLNYKRISSTFTHARKHPVYKTVRPHTGVDYAAPAGTPVQTIGDGTVIEKGYKGDAGNMVKIRHNSTYTTAYLHLSKYGKIAVGQHVSQGDVIGYVGSTGASTGPHLDFRVWKNGTPVDPLKMESPSADPVPNKYKTQFDSIVNQYSQKL